MFVVLACQGGCRGDSPEEWGVRGAKSSGIFFGVWKTLSFNPVYVKILPFNLRWQKQRLRSHLLTKSWLFPMLNYLSQNQMFKMAIQKVCEKLKDAGEDIEGLDIGN